MGAEVFLSVAAEIAIGIAGFAGIVSVVMHRDKAGLTDTQVIWLQILLTAEAAAITFALFPFVLKEAQIAEAVIWKSGSFLMLLWLVVAGYVRKRQADRLPTPIKLPTPAFVWMAIIIVLQSYNLVAGGYSWPYMVAVYGLVANGFLAFVLLLMAQVKQIEKST